MGTNARNTVGLKLIQLASDTYVIQHQCLLSPMKTVKIGEEMLIVYPNTVDPIIFDARLLELWQEGDVLFLKLWNFNHQKEDLYTQDLTTEDCLFSFITLPFITKLAEIVTGKCKPESCMESNQNISEPVQSKSTSVNIKDKHGLPQPFYNNFGKMVMKYISASEIMLDLPFILTQNKRLKLNMPYLKAENNLSGNKTVAVRLLGIEVKDEVLILNVQEIQSERLYTLEWNMDYTNAFWMWSLTDFQTAIKFHKSIIK